MRVRILPWLLILSFLVVAPSARADFVRALGSPDGVDVIAVGDGGQILRSLDGGATWNATTLGTRPLTGVAARDHRVLIVGDGGYVWRSVDSGGHFTLHINPGLADLRALCWATPDTAIAVGAGGAIWISADAGVTWHAQTSGTGERLNAVKFSGASEGWIAGDHGVALHTTNGGALWTAVVTPTTQTLNAVDFRGATVWLAGARAVALKSTMSGAVWTQLNLRLDAAADVRVVRMAGADTVYLAGGGGFVRRSTDGGTTWTFLVHTLQAPVSDLYFAGGHGWLASDRSRLIQTTTDAGDTWTGPAGALTFRSWPKVCGASGTARGATLTLNPVDLKTLYGFRGRALYRSRDDGDTWTVIDSVLGTTTTRTNAFLISRKDTNVMLAAVSMPQRIVRSTDGGHTWTDILAKVFGEFGVPLEQDPDHPDTVLFGPDGDVLYRSTDFGLNWTPYSTYSFRSPCDIAICPESDSSVVVVADGITNSGLAWLHRSVDGGVNWSAVYAPTSNIGNGSEIPELAVSRLRPNVVFGTSWSNGPARRSTDRALTWNTVLGTQQTWGVDIAKDDPNLVVTAQFLSGDAYITFDGGSNFAYTPGLSGSNYSFYARDRALILAEQSTGFYKLAVQDSVPITSAQSVTMTSPNGGESWAAGSVQDLTWTTSNVALVNLEYRTGPAEAWLPIAQVTGYAGHYAWTVPNAATTQAEVRVRDAWDLSPSDASDATFAITTTLAAGDEAAQFALWPNLPNPFERSTAIRYAVPVRAHVKLDVFDLQGKRVATLVNTEQAPGTYAVRFDDAAAGGARLAAGVYFARLEAGTFRATRKMLLAR